MASPTSPRWLDYLPVEELQGADRNPKGHDLDAIGESIDRFGYIEPIVLDERTGRLVSGHGRMTQLLIAQNDPGRDGNPPEGIMIDDDGRWLVPVVRGWSSKNDLEAEMMLLAVNQLTIAGGWADPSELLDLLTAGREAGGLTGTGFSEQEVDDLLALLSPPPSLDDLADEHGEPDPADFWPVLRFKVPPELRERFVKLTAHIVGGDHDAFAFLVEQAERGAAATP